MTPEPTAPAASLGVLRLILISLGVLSITALLATSILLVNAKSV